MRRGAGRFSRVRFVLKRRFFFQSVIIIAVSAGLFFLRGSEFMSRVDEAVLHAFTPVMEASMAVRAYLFSFFSEKKECVVAPPLDARTRDLEFEALRRENADLRSLLDFQESAPFRLVNARTLLYAKDAGVEFLVIGKGARDGVRVGHYVMTRDRLVLGRIEKNTDTFSHVAIASNPGESYEAEVLPGILRAFGKGAGSRTFELEFIPEDTPVMPGDLVRFILRGAPPLFLAEVASARREANSAFQRVRATLLARPEQAEEVIVLVPEA